MKHIKVKILKKNKQKVRKEKKTFRKNGGNIGIHEIAHGLEEKMIDIDSTHLIDFVEFSKRKRAKRSQVDWYLFQKGFDDANEHLDKTGLKNVEKSFFEKKMKAVLGISSIPDSLQNVNCDTHSEQDTIICPDDDNYISDLTKKPNRYGDGDCFINDAYRQRNVWFRLNVDVMMFLHSRVIVIKKHYIDSYANRSI